MEEAKKELVKLMKHLRRFNDDDYDGFAGAESDDPLINDNIILNDGELKLKECIMIIDDKAVEIYYYPYLNDPDDDDYLDREETIFYKEFESEDLINLFISHEAKNLEGDGLSTEVLKRLYGFQKH